MKKLEQKDFDRLAEIRERYKILGEENLKLLEEYKNILFREVTEKEIEEIQIRYHA